MSARSSRQQPQNRATTSRQQNMAKAPKPTGKPSPRPVAKKVRRVPTVVPLAKRKESSVSQKSKPRVKPRTAITRRHPSMPTRIRPFAPKMTQVSRAVPSHQAPTPKDALVFVIQGLDKWWQDYLTCLNHFLQSASARNVHDLRVAIRHLATVFDLIDRFNPDNMVRRARASLKDQQSALSSLRDAHVEMVRMRTFLKEFPEMKTFHDELLDKEAQQLKDARKIPWKSDRKFIETAFNRAMLRLNARRATSSGDSARKIIDASIDVLFDNLSKKLERITPADYATIHRVRLAFKPLRDTLELLQPLLGLEAKQLRTATLLARMMGQIQDLEVLMKDLVESSWRKESMLSTIVEIWLSLERQKTDTAQRFLRAVPKFSNIWKPIIHDQPIATSNLSKTLFVLRHGIATPRGDPTFPLDSDRPLTAKGIKRMRRIADGMRRIRVGFDIILSSPYRRSLETAFVVAREFEVGQSVQTVAALKPEVLPEEVVRTLLESYSPIQRILLVGHEPQLSALASTLTSGGGSARPLLKKGGLCKLQVERLQLGKCASLVWLLTPRQMMSLA